MVQKMAEFVLGTANFNSDYSFKPMTKEECFKILDVARENGIHKLDTATAYDDLWVFEYEQETGHLFTINHKVTTKEDIEDSISSLESQCVMLHDQNDIYNFKKMNELAKIHEGYSYTGVSIYDNENFYDAIKMGFDIIQFQYNIADIRHSSNIGRAKQKGIVTQARSAFLKGLLLMDITSIPVQYSHLKPYLVELDIICVNNNISRAKACLDFVELNKDIDEIVIGVDTAAQLLELIELKKEPNLAAYEEVKTLSNIWDLKLDLRG